MKYALLIPAAILDIVQFVLGWAFIALQFSTPAGGAVGGGLAGALYCWNTSTGIISGIFDAAQCAITGAFVGTALTTFATPIGAAIDVALSMVVGGAIIMMLAMNGMFYPKVILPRLLGEIMPFFSFLPIWTNMVWKSIQEKKKREAGAHTVQGAWNFVAGTAATVIPGGTLAQAAAKLAQRRFAPADSQTEPQGNSAPFPERNGPALLTRFSDIRRAPRAANDNEPRKAYAA